MKDSLNELLTLLSHGSSAAIERVFQEYEPYLRKAVRRQLPLQLRPKLDTTDILQSVWVDLLRHCRNSEWRFANVDQLRGFLYIATRNRLIDRIRQHRRAADREERLDEDGAQYTLLSPKPRPSEIAQAEDVWERLLACCPAEHRPILDLRRQGYSLGEIAAHCGLHPDSVRRVLRALARKMAFGGPGKQDRPQGDRV